MTKEIIEYNLRCAKFLGMEDDAYILQQIIKKIQKSICYFIMIGDG